MLIARFYNGSCKTQAANIANTTLGSSLCFRLRVRITVLAATSYTRCSLAIYALVMPRRRQLPSSLVDYENMHQLFCCLLTEKVFNFPMLLRVIGSSFAQGVDLYVHAHINVKVDTQVSGCWCKQRHDCLRPRRRCCRLFAVTRSDVDSGGSC